MLNDWTCVPQTGYTVSVTAPGASFQILTSGSTVSSSGTLGSNTKSFQFLCSNLPAVIFLKGIKPGKKAAIKATDGLPWFAFWDWHYGPVAIYPLKKPVATTGLLTIQGPTDPAAGTLLRFPAMYP